MSDERLCYLPATEALASFRSGRLSPVELMQAIADRSEQVEPHINAFTETYFERALEEAREAEQRYARARRSKSNGAFLLVADALPVEQQRAQARCAGDGVGRVP